MQLGFVEQTLTKETRRKVERLLSSYRSMGAIIAAMESDIPEQRMTQNYNISESQRTESISSQVESIILAKEKIDQKKKTKEKLDRVYKSLRPIQQEIWEQRYVHGRYDDIVIMELDVSRRKYYREKTAMIIAIAEVFFLL